MCWFCIFASEGSVKIISGLGARKYRERYTMVILNTHQHTSEVNIIENIHLHSIYLVDTAPLTIFLFLRQDLECCQYNNGCSQLSKLEELNMKDESRNGLKNILNEYLGQTMLAKIFPLQGWCRGNFFPSSISDPILTNIGQIPQLHQNIGVAVGLHSLSGYKTWFLPLDLLCSTLLYSALLGRSGPNHLPL